MRTMITSVILMIMAPPAFSWGAVDGPYQGAVYHSIAGITTVKPPSSTALGDNFYLGYQSAGVSVIIASASLPPAYYSPPTW